MAVKRQLCREAAITQDEVWSLSKFIWGSALRGDSNKRFVNTRENDEISKYTEDNRSQVFTV